MAELDNGEEKTDRCPRSGDRVREPSPTLLSSVQTQSIDHLEELGLKERRMVNGAGGLDQKFR